MTDGALPLPRAALDAAWEAGRAAFPTVSADRSRFDAHVTAKLADLEDTVVALAHLNAPGLYLAAAVLAREPTAVQALVELLPSIDSPLRQLGADAARLEELRQVVLELVVVGTGTERGPAISTYAGRSDLRSWLRSVAVRRALKQWSRERTPDALDDDDALIELADDPALAHLKTTYAEQVATATREAIAALTPRARTLLRLHHLDQLSVDEIGRVYNVHRATAARWIANARETIFEETRVRLETRLGLGEQSVVSVVRLVQSELGLSMRRLLASQ